MEREQTFMKKILPFLVLVLATSACNKQSNSCSSSSHPKGVIGGNTSTAKLGGGGPVIILIPGIDVVVDGVLLHCVSSGPICDGRIEWLPQGAAWPTLNNGEYSGTLTLENGKIIDHFDKSEMNSDVLQHFSNGYMNMVQERTFNVEITSAVGLTQPYVITQGAHPYTESNGEIHVEL